MRSNFGECESFLKPNFPDIFTLCEVNLENSIDCSNFSVRSYLPMIRKDSITHMHGFSLCEEGISFYVELISRKLLKVLIYVFDWLYFIQCLTSFSFVDLTFRARFLMVFYLIHLLLYLFLETLTFII